MIDFTRRHMHRHWRVNLAVFLCLMLASALLAGFSGYTAAIAERELSQSLAEARPAERHLLVTGPRTAFRAELDELLQEKLGEVLQDLIVIRHALSPANDLGDIALLDLYSFNRLPEMVRVVEGQLPNQVRLREVEESWRPPPIEAVIGAAIAEQFDYGIGDRLTGRGGYHRLDIVGIVEPLGPSDDVWGEDLSAFAIVTGTDEVTAAVLPLIIASGSMRSHYPEPPIFPHEVSWRVLLDHSRIRVDRAETLHADLINIQTQSATLGASIDTGLVRILAETLSRLSRVQMVFLLLSVQSLLFVLFTLTMFMSLVVDRSEVELATLSVRGLSIWQITRVFALENLILVVPAAFLGLILAQGMILIWSKSTEWQIPRGLPRDAWLLAGLVAGLGWVALVLPVFLAARRTVHGGPQRESILSPLMVAQRYYLDLYLLAFGVLLYWQLNQAGSFVARALSYRRQGDIQLADPLLLIGPSLLLFAAALALLRFWPLLVRLGARLCRRWRGWVLSLGLLRLARDPRQANLVVLLVSLTTGLILFTQTFRNSMAGNSLPFDVLAQGVGNALQVNTLTLLLFSVAAFFLVRLVTVQGRARAQWGASEISVLRSMGVSAGQSLILFGIESLLMMVPGLLAGTVIGLGLSYIMIPYLSQALGESFIAMPTGRFCMDWSTLAQLYLVLISVYGLALALLLLVLARRRSHWTVWLEDK